jgi:hypothetical protein
MVENDGMRPQEDSLDRKELIGPLVVFMILDLSMGIAFWIGASMV